MDKPESNQVSESPPVAGSQMSVKRRPRAARRMKHGAWDGLQPQENGCEIVELGTMQQ